MATYWATLTPLYQGCDGIIELTDLAADDTELTAEDLDGATVTLILKPSASNDDSEGSPYAGDVDVAGSKPVIRFAIPAADLAVAGNRWGYAAMLKDSKRHVLAYGPVRVVDL